jgi:hypothetical protein
MLQAIRKLDDMAVAVHISKKKNARPVGQAILIIPSEAPHDEEQ